MRGITLSIFALALAISGVEAAEELKFPDYKGSAPDTKCKDDTRAAVIGTVSKVEKGEHLSDGRTQWEIWLQTIESGDCYVEVITMTNRPPPDDCKKGVNVIASGFTSRMLVPELEAVIVICWR